ncbi:hypothetical protein IMSAGC011_03021 [Lachnospiraceae bacterium]|nr:hypothetical protein IMSAGC011_03021 [Lachnospiraceae bacterium]
MSKRKVCIEDKIYAMNLYLNGKESQRRIAFMFGVRFDFMWVSIFSTKMA